jgi:chromosome segregation ATPase
MGNLKAWLAGGAILGLAVTNGFMINRSSRFETEVAKIKAATAEEIASVRDLAAKRAAATDRTLEDLNQQVSSSKAHAASVAAQAKINAQRHAEKLISGIFAKHKEELEEREQHRIQTSTKLQEELGAVKQANEANQGKIQEVATEVGTVKTEVATAKTALETTIAELKSVRGDLGIQSGLIATNSKELSALRELGERNYFEFAVSKQNRAVKVGNVMMTLKKTDLKRNRYSVEVVADDKRVEKKDKTVNEPVQFYVSGLRQPYEIVVNEIHKDKLVGYLATPKLITARR